MPLRSSTRSSRSGCEALPGADRGSAARLADHSRTARYAHRGARRGRARRSPLSREPRRLLRLALAGNSRSDLRRVRVAVRALSNEFSGTWRARSRDPGGWPPRPAGLPEIRALVRDRRYAARERQRMVRRPPHILVTTPESLYLVLTGAKSRGILRHVETVIVDEIHACRDRAGRTCAVAGAARRFSSGQWAVAVASRSGGFHCLLPTPTAHCFEAGARRAVGDAEAIDELGLFLVGSPPRAAIVGRRPPCELDIQVEVPRLELQAVCTHEPLGGDLRPPRGTDQRHRSTLIFVNTRKLASAWRTS